MLKRLRLRLRGKRELKIGLFILCIDKTHIHNHTSTDGITEPFSSCGSECICFLLSLCEVFFSLLCSYGRHPFKISCLHVIHRNCLLQLLYKPSLTESLQIYLLFRQFKNISEKPQRRGSQASHLDTIFFLSLA